MKKFLILATVFYIVFFGFAFLLDSAMEKESEFNEIRQNRFDCLESGLDSECNL